MPDSVKKQIEYEAQTSDRRVSATQDAPVFRTPPETKKSASLFNPEIGQRATFQPHNGKTKLTGIVKEESAETLAGPGQKANRGDSPVFYGTYQEDADAFWKSHNRNIECAEALGAAFTRHFAENRIDIEAVIEDTKEFSAERMSIVLANTMRDRERDGRFSPANRKWQESVTLPASVFTHYTGMNSHSILVDYLVETLRERGAPEHGQQTAPGIYENERILTQEREARAEEQTPDTPPFEPQISQRVTFEPYDGKTKLTGIVKEVSETKEYAKERAQKHAGENGNVYTARGEAVYNGTILETTPTFAIQKVGEDAILHRLKDLGKADGEKSLIQPGQDVSIVKKAKGVVTTEPWDRQRKEKERENQRRNDAHSR
jgi:hypothetical protein